MQDTGTTSGNLTAGLITKQLRYNLTPEFLPQDITEDINEVLSLSPRPRRSRVEVPPQRRPFRSLEKSRVTKEETDHHLADEPEPRVKDELKNRTVSEKKTKKRSNSHPLEKKKF